MANPDEVSLPFGLSNQTLDFPQPQPHPPDTRQQGPLVIEWLELGIQEHAVAVTARHRLEREGDQIAEAALGHRVLARKEAVVGIESQVMPMLHGAGQDGRTEFPGETGRQRRGKENPDVPAASRA